MTVLKLTAEDQGIIDAYRQLKQKESVIKQEIEEIHPYILEIMEDYNLKNLENDYLSVTYLPESTSISFDSSKFKKENPDLVEQYQKETVRKAHIRVKLKE